MKRFTKSVYLLALTLSVVFLACNTNVDDFIPSYTVTFNTNGGSEIPSQTVTRDNVVAKPNNPVKDGYSFEAWYLDEGLTTPFNFSNRISKDTTLFAKWNKNSEISLPVTDTEKNEDDDTDVVLEENQRLIKFDTDGGTKIPKQIVVVGAMVFKPLDPVKTGYTFRGWFIDENHTTPFDFDKPISTNMTIYAKWEINFYKVTFVYDNYYNNKIEKSFAYNSLIEPPETPTKRGYTFVGWFSSGFKQYDFTNPVTGQITIYARWKINTYTFTFDSRGGSEISSQSIEYGCCPNYYSLITEKDGSEFIGWEDENGYRYYSTVYGNYEPIYSDIKLYAIWKPIGKNYISVTIHPQSDIEVSKTQNDSIITFYVSNDYNILGWYIDGQKVESSNTYSLDTSTWKKGSYILELEASKNGMYYSYTAQIKIE